MYDMEGDFGKYIYGNFFRSMGDMMWRGMMVEVLQYNISRIWST